MIGIIGMILLLLAFAFSNKIGIVTYNVFNAIGSILFSIFAAFIVNSTTFCLIGSIWAIISVYKVCNELDIRWKD